jgi:hypothetical protein
MPPWYMWGSLGLIIFDTWELLGAPAGIIKLMKPGSPRHQQPASRCNTFSTFTLSPIVLVRNSS